MPGLLGTVWPALLVALVAVGATALAGWHADRVWLVPAGALLVAVAAAIAFDGLAGAWSAWWALSGARDGDTVFVMDGSGSPEVSGALAAAVALVGPALLAIGALRASRDAGPDRPGTKIV